MQLFSVLNSMPLSNVFGLWSSIVAIIGSYILSKGFFGKKYELLYSESASMTGYNKAAYTSLSEQKNSGVIGFRILLLGFIEQAISYIPYQTPMSVFEVTTILTIT
ncbi:hypothetical protein SBF1_5000005 [Candidatus Desulfosporosinus infrequens]|uniref:Uncharacterized protein n=1 Tax=Candidatus Desulfosporosinus infrequens TaxID=2043169 RepID=A0A2U3LHJ9_9FIRM|nr:hypothetical protein SBF1_5000005 [Candidatus Desulfosporosinus infrequens]